MPDEIILEDGIYSARDLNFLVQQSKDLKEIYVVCPKCQKSKKLKIPKSLFENYDGSLISIIIRKGKICSHSIFLYIDKEFQIRSIEVPHYYCE